MSDEKRELSVQEMPITYKTLAVLSSSPTIPQAYRNKPGDMLAVALQGRALGIDPLTAINNMDMIDGTISMRAKLMSALIHGRGHIIKVKQLDESACILECFRWHEGAQELIHVGDVPFTIEDAENAGLVGRDTYEKYPKQMLSNRAMTMAARLFYGDCLAGVGYSPNELDENITPENVGEILLEEELGAEVVSDTTDNDVIEAEAVDA